MKFSIVSPVYKAENIIPELVERIVNSVTQITGDYEIILVEDNSPDNSWEKVQEETKKNPNVTGIKLSKNFGQHAAITAGLDHCSGDWVVIMDCDLQDQPEEIPKLWNKTKEGFKIVKAQRVERKDKPLKKMFSFLFYRLLSYLTGCKHDPSIANFGIYNKQVIKALSKFRESIRYFPVMINFVGFKATSIPIEHSERTDGSSTYNFKNLIKLAVDIVLANSDKPMKLTIKAGLIISASSVTLAIYTVVKFINGDIVVEGYFSIILSIWFFSGGIITTMGIMGLYIGKTFEQVKGRPIYIVESQIGHSDNTAE
jgi:polyisoprenyl-phosphate glycosyltransferase